MFSRLGNFVARWRWTVIAAWILLLLLLRPPARLSEILSSLGISYRGAPKWNDVTYDGDLAYLPAGKPSVRGERLLEQAFPRRRARSQIVIVAARDQGDMTRQDAIIANGISCWFHNLQGAVGLRQVQQLDRSADASEQESAADLARQRAALLNAAQAALEESILIDERINDLSSPTGKPLPRLAAPYHNLALLQQMRGQTSEAQENRKIANLLDPTLKDQSDQVCPAVPEELPLLDVWDWHDEVFGRKLISEDKQARLVVLQLSNEFMATDNIRVLEFVEQELQRALRQSRYSSDSGLRIGVSGSAAVGGDMLRAAAESIRNTELVTVVLVIVILGLVYRSPLLILIPLVTILVSLLTALSLVAALTQLHLLPGFGWWDLKVFTTTRIFIVVILLGAGTDYCLFMISRFKEELATGLDTSQSIVATMVGVGDALAASALTTILGLAMMFFASFGKFKYSGPVIGICLAVALIACLTLTPAILRICGAWAYWPQRLGPAEGPSKGAPEGADSRRQNGKADREPSKGRFHGFWTWIAERVLTYPGRILIVAVALLLPLTIYGVLSAERVTYDLLQALSSDRPSKRGAELLKRHFPVGESGPITILVNKPNAQFATVDGYTMLLELCNRFYLDGVQSVRSIADPLGEFPPPRGDDKQFPSIVKSSGRRLHFLRAHPRTQELLVGGAGRSAGNVARIEIIANADPFSPEAALVLERIDQVIAETQLRVDRWKDAEVAYTGVTAGIRDLRDVTRGDTRRIQVLVVLAVLAVLLVILRRPLVCLYLIATVLVSYYFTLGATQLFFSYVYGQEFAGLDWKTPIFLFVILVAVGQDYNVYLATRVFEEQKRWGPREGLKRAIIHTGGIITSCGVIMAGTFASMTAGTWGDIPLLRYLVTGQGALLGIVQLGFALSLGIVVDTFIVRTILAPAFLALLGRR